MKTSGREPGTNSIPRPIPCFRLPIHGSDSASSLEMFGHLMSQREVTVGTHFSGFEVVEREPRVVDDDLRVWREFELTYERGRRKMSMAVRVDPVTKAASSGLR